MAFKLYLAFGAGLCLIGTVHLVLQYRSRPKARYLLVAAFGALAFAFVLLTAVTAPGR